MAPDPEKVDYIVTDMGSPDAPCRGTLGDLIVDAYLIAPCGLIPPYRLLRALLRQGRSGGGMSPGCQWEPFELTEAQYAQAIELLEQMTPDDLQSRHRDPQIQGEIRPDYAAPDTDEIAIWRESLKHRQMLPPTAPPKRKRAG